jgi:hypothetical protein
MTNILKGQYRLMTNQAKLGPRLDLNDKNYLTVSPPNIVFYFKSTLNLFLRQKLQIQDGPRRGAALGLVQGVTKRCRQSLLTNSALVYESQAGGWGWELRGLSQ